MRAVLTSRAKFKTPAADDQRTAFHQTACHAFAGCQIQSLHRGTGHPHLPGTFFLGHPYIIQETDALIFLQRNIDLWSIFPLLRYEMRTGRKSTYPAFFRWPAHHQPPFLTYALIISYHIFDICQFTHRTCRNGCIHCISSDCRRHGNEGCNSLSACPAYTYSSWHSRG